VDIIEDGLTHVCLMEHASARTGRVTVGGPLSLPQLPAADFERLTIPGHGALASQPSVHQLPILPVQGPSYTQREAQPSARSLNIIAFGHPVLDAFQPLALATSRAVTCGNRRELAAHLLHGALAALSELQSACPVHVVFVSIGGSAGQHNSTSRSLSLAGKRFTHVSAPAAAPLGQRYLAPFTGMAIAQELGRQGRHALLVVADLTAHAEAARQVAGVSWADMMAAPTNTGPLMDAACMVKHGGSVTVVAGAVGTPSGGPGVAHSGGEASESGAAGRGQGMLADRSVNPSSISTQDTKGQEWLDQFVSLASSSYHLYGNSAVDAAAGHLPVPEEVLTWANGHKAQGDAMCKAARATLGLLRELRLAATQACTALEYGIAPEADQDRNLAYYAKMQMLLNPSARLLHAVEADASAISEVRLGLIAADASEQALSFFESTQEAAKGTARPIGNFPDPKLAGRMTHRGGSTNAAPTSVPWLKVDRAAWMSMIPGFGKRSVHSQATAVPGGMHKASLSSKAGGADGGSVLDKFASKMSAEQLQALRAAQAKRKPRGAAASKPTVASTSTANNAAPATPKKPASSPPKPAAPAADEMEGLMGKAAASTDDFDDLIAALERGGSVPEADVEVEEAALVTPSIPQGGEAEVEVEGRDGTATKPPLAVVEVPEGGPLQTTLGAEQGVEAPDATSTSKVGLQDGERTPSAAIPVDRTFLRLLLISSGVLSKVPTRHILQFEQMVFDVTSSMSVGAAAKLCAADVPAGVRPGMALLAFSRHENLSSDVHLATDMDSILQRGRVAPWKLCSKEQEHFHLINHVVFACRELFLN